MNYNVSYLLIKDNRKLFWFFDSLTVPKKTPGVQITVLHENNQNIIDIKSK